MIKEDYIEKYTGKFIYIVDTDTEEDSYVYVKDLRSCWFFRPIGIYNFDFNFYSWSGVFCKSKYTTTEMSQPEWMKKVIPCIFKI